MSPETFLRTRDCDKKNENNTKIVKQVSIVVYYESRKRDLEIRLINEGRCDERMKGKVEESTYLTYTGLNDKTN